MPTPKRRRCTCARSVRLVCVAGTCVSITAAAPADSKIYWTDRGDGSITRANLDGSGLEVLLTGLPGPQGVAVDPLEGRIYWADSTLLQINRANLDGSNPETVLDGAGLFIPVGLAFDPVNRTLYWTDPVSGRVQRAALDNPTIEDFQTGANATQDVVVDPVLGQVYWSQGPAGILYAPIGGGAPIPLLQSFIGSATAFAQAPLPCQVVWRAADRITRADCLGIGTQDLLLSPGDVIGIALDPTSSTIYWTDSAGGSIRRLEEGAPTDQTIISGLTMPWRLTIGPADAPPIITTQPHSQAIDDGATAVLFTQATGRQPLAYQWLRDAAPLADDAHIAGALSPTLSVIASPADIGLYQCVVSNLDGSTPSIPVALAVRRCNADGTPPPASIDPCAADIDGDCDVDILDFTVFSTTFGSTVLPGSSGDFDCDGQITILDFSIFSAQFGCSQGSP